MFVILLSGKACSGQAGVGCKAAVTCNNAMRFSWKAHRCSNNLQSRSWLVSLMVVAKVKGSRNIEGKLLRFLSIVFVSIALT